MKTDFGSAKRESGHARRRKSSDFIKAEKYIKQFRDLYKRVKIRGRKSGIVQNRCTKSDRDPYVV